MILKPQAFPVVLKHGPVTFQSPYPAKQELARAQLKTLAGFMSSVRRHVEKLWQQVKDGSTLSKDSIAGLEIIFGTKTLIAVGLIPASPKPKKQRPPDPAQQLIALSKLLHRFDQLLAKKSKRLRVLRERVLSGYTLHSADESEIREMFGADLAGELGFWTKQMTGPAAVALLQQPRAAVPCIEIEQTHADPLSQEEAHPRWYPRNNLLASSGKDRHFVAEIDNDRRAHLRFGDGELGRAPEPSSKLHVRYRLGNGVRGNVGAETISHIVFRQLESIGANLTVRNPLPAQGGEEPESIEEVRMFAPGAFRKELQRAIAADDYARLAERDQLTRVQRAAADLRWTGSWYEVRTGIDPLGVEGTQPQLLEDILKSLYRFRRINHDLAVDTARYVPLNIALHVCVLPHYLRGHVKAALEEVFSNRILPGGKRGFFHPDNLTFGDGIYLSALVAVAQAVEGVESVRVTRLERLFEGANGELASGFLPLSPREVARVDTDPNFPEYGLFTLDVGGGR
jgi:predicted phage baseplate assembly protein